MPAALPGASFPGRSHSWDAVPVPARSHRRRPRRVPFEFLAGACNFSATVTSVGIATGVAPLSPDCHPTPPSQFPRLAQAGRGYLGPIPPFQLLPNPTAEPRRRFGKQRCREAAARRCSEPGTGYRKVSPGQPQSREPENPGFNGRPNLRESCQQWRCRQ